MTDRSYHLNRIKELEALLASHRALAEHSSSSGDVACQPQEIMTWSKFQSLHPCNYISFNSKEIFEDLAVWIHGTWRDSGNGFEPPTVGTLEHYQLQREYHQAHVSQLRLNIDWAEHQLAEAEMIAKYKSGPAPSDADHARINLMRKNLSVVEAALRETEDKVRELQGGWLTEAERVAQFRATRDAERAARVSSR